MKSLRAGLYARVSTADQQTLPLQIAAMHEYAVHRGWTGAVCVEDIASGAKKRPKRQELEKLAKQRKIDVILVWRLDRWGRSLKDLVESLPELTAAGVGFISITEALDLTTPTGRAMVGMLSVFAEFERDIICEPVRAGLADAKKKGKVLGRPRTVDKVSAQIRNQFAQGVNKHQIAKRLQLGHGSVFRVLSASENGQSRP